MKHRVDANLKQELKEFGIHEWNECYHCGNCTASCPLAEDHFTFPRKSIRYLQMGLKDKMSSTLDPWLCYYCGDCSKTCPRDANPGELMMTLRRYMTSVYDWTGLSRKFYTSHYWEFGFIASLFLMIIALFAIFLPVSPEVIRNPSAFLNSDGGVMINNLSDKVSSSRFLQIIEAGDLIMAAIVATLLVSNILRMFYKVILKDQGLNVPFTSYFLEFWQLIFNFSTQPKFSKCDRKNYWVGHFLLMSGYTIMFTLIVGLLPQFQIEEIKPWYNWQRILGYYATFGLLFFLAYSAYGRIKKNDLKFRFSHITDWLFIIMLSLTTITGILVHIFRLAGLPLATYYMYVFHLAVLVPMVIIEVPFSKWSHLAYRPFAVYFSRLKKAAYRKNEKVSKLAFT